VTLKDKSPDKRDGLNWKYIKGAATTLADFGDPLTSTDYTVCIYDSSRGRSRSCSPAAPAGGTCGTKPCWKTIKGGFKYNDKLFDPERPAAGAAQVGHRHQGEDHREGEGHRPADADRCR
jgi:hypothetical protein